MEKKVGRGGGEAGARRGEGEGKGRGRGILNGNFRGCTRVVTADKARVHEQKTRASSTDPISPRVTTRAGVAAAHAAQEEGTRRRFRDVSPGASLGDPPPPDRSRRSPTTLLSWHTRINLTSPVSREIRVKMGRLLLRRRSLLFFGSPRRKDGTRGPRVETDVRDR